MKLPFLVYCYFNLNTKLISCFFFIDTIKHATSEDTEKKCSIIES